MTTVKTILNNIDSMPLSNSLGKALRLSQQTKSKDFEKWCRLELIGYSSSNPAMDENIVVPEYRTVVGQHADYYGRPLILEENLSFINKTRLRHGVPEIENILNTRDMIVIQDPQTCALIKKFLKVEVHFFRFSPSSLSGILSSIKMQLSDRLMNITDAIEEDHGSLNENIIELKPNIYGVGIDLKALWKKWKRLSGKK